MKLVRRLGAKALAASALAALVLGGMTLTATPARAAMPILLCGPSFLWECTASDGSTVLFAGTLCDKARFERRSGSVCVPYAG